MHGGAPFRCLHPGHDIQRDAQLVILYRIVAPVGVVRRRVVILDEEEVDTLVAADKILISVEAETLLATPSPRVSTGESSVVAPSPMLLDVLGLWAWSMLAVTLGTCVKC